MDANSNPQSSSSAPAGRFSVKIFGVGNAGIKVMEQLLSGGLPGTSFVAVDTDPQSLADCSASERVHLDTKVLRGLGTGGDPARGQAVAEENLSNLKSLFQGASVLFIITGLGGGSGTGVVPTLARAAKEAGAQVFGFVTTPFDCEGSRGDRAQQGLDDLKEIADGVICLPNQKVLKLIDENTCVLDVFKRTNELLAEGIRGIWRLLSLPGPIQIHFEEVCDLLRDRHTESAFATAEAMGPTRSREVLDKLTAHPLLDGGRLLREADSLLVSLMGGPDLTMAEIDRVMEQIKQQSGDARVIMGAAIDESFRDRMAVTVIAAINAPERPEPARGAAAGSQDLPSQLLNRSNAERPGSRFVPPAPALPPDKVQQLIGRQSRGSRARKTISKMRQGQLPLEIVSKGRFDKSEPTIHKGEDLDVPTYIRRGVALN